MWKILKEMRIPDHLTCLLRNLYGGQETTVRTRHGTTDWFKIGKGIHQGWLLSPFLFNFYAEYIMWNSRLDKAQAGIFPGEIPLTSDMHITPPLWQKEKRNWRAPLMKVKEKSEKVGLKLNIQKAKIMASGPIFSWHWQTLLSWVPKSLQMVTAAMKLKGACSLEENLWPT